MFRGRRAVPLAGLLIAALLPLVAACGGGDEPEPTATPDEAAQASSRPDGIRIPAIRVDAPLKPKALAPGQALPSPDGPYDVALYDFGAGLRELGGLPGEGGNVVLAGLNAALEGCVGTRPPCAGVFGLLSELPAGASIDVTWRGRIHEYQVVSLCIVATSAFNSAGGGVNGLYRRTPEEQLTLLTGAGALTDSGWSQVLVLIAKPAPQTAIEPCPPGTESLAG